MRIEALAACCNAPPAEFDRLMCALERRLTLVVASHAARRSEVLAAVSDAQMVLDYGSMCSSHQSSDLPRYGTYVLPQGTCLCAV